MPVPSAGDTIGAPGRLTYGPYARTNPKVFR
eukprot:COSAG02_NODE_37053_length_447_cov_0.701149_1_plen_30_part_01